MLIIEELRLNRIVNHCKKQYPQEACGLLVGKHNKVEGIFSTKNVRNSSSEYLVDPEQQFKIFEKIQSENKELLGIYHSHPATSAFPSAKDKQRAFYPETSYVIVSLQNFSNPQIRCFKIREGKVFEEEMKVTNKCKT